MAVQQRRGVPSNPFRTGARSTYGNSRGGGLPTHYGNGGYRSGHGNGNTPLARLRAVCFVLVAGGLGLFVFLGGASREQSPLIADVHPATTESVPGGGRLRNKFGTTLDRLEIMESPSKDGEGNIQPDERFRSADSFHRSKNGPISKSRSFGDRDVALDGPNSRLKEQNKAPKAPSANNKDALSHKELSENRLGSTDNQVIDDKVSSKGIPTEQVIVGKGEGSSADEGIVTTDKVKDHGEEEKTSDEKDPEKSGAENTQDKISYTEDVGKKILHENEENALEVAMDTSFVLVEDKRGKDKTKEDKVVDDKTDAKDEGGLHGPPIEGGHAPWEELADVNNFLPVTKGSKDDSNKKKLLVEDWKEAELEIFEPINNGDSEEELLQEKLEIVDEGKEEEGSHKEELVDLDNLGGKAVNLNTKLDTSKEESGVQDSEKQKTADAKSDEKGDGVKDSNTNVGEEEKDGRNSKRASTEGDKKDGEKELLKVAEEIKVVSKENPTKFQDRVDLSEVKESSAAESDSKNESHPFDNLNGKRKEPEEGSTPRKDSDGEPTPTGILNAAKKEPSLGLSPADALNKTGPGEGSAPVVLTESKGESSSADILNAAKKEAEEEPPLADIVDKRKDPEEGSTPVVFGDSKGETSSAVILNSAKNEAEEVSALADAPLEEYKLVKESPLADIVDKRKDPEEGSTPVVFGDSKGETSSAVILNSAKNEAEEVSALADAPLQEDKLVKEGFTPAFPSPKEKKDTSWAEEKVL